MSESNDGILEVAIHYFVRCRFHELFSILLQRQVFQYFLQVQKKHSVHPRESIVLRRRISAREPSIYFLVYNTSFLSLLSFSVNINWKIKWLNKYTWVNRWKANIIESLFKFIQLAFNKGGTWVKIFYQAGAFICIFFVIFSHL